MTPAPSCPSGSLPGLCSQAPEVSETYEGWSASQAQTSPPRPTPPHPARARPAPCLSLTSKVWRPATHGARAGGDGACGRGAPRLTLVPHLGQEIPLTGYLLQPVCLHPAGPLSPPPSSVGPPGHPLYPEGEQAICSPCSAPQPATPSPPSPSPITPWVPVQLPLPGAQVPPRLALPTPAC